MSSRDGNIGIDASKRPLTVPPAFAAYAEKHGVFDMFEAMTKDLVINQPTDPLAHILNFLNQRPVPKIFVHGPMGSKRKALCNQIAEKTHVVHLDIDSIIKAAIEQETEHGIAAKKFVDDEDPVPNSVLVPLVLARLSEGDCLRNGYVLRGFPKTRAQAVALQIKGQLPTHVFVLTGTTEKSALGYLEGLKAIGTCETLPSSFDLQDSLDEFRVNLPEYVSTFQTILSKIDATASPADMFAAVWTRLCTQRQSNAPFIPRVMVLGPAGSGDCSQADALAKKYGAVAIHYQDVIQRAAAVGDAVARVIKSSLKTGRPIPDATLHSLFAREIGHMKSQTRGWVLTGYPKTATQARLLLDAGLAPNRTYFLDVETNTALDRLEGQRVDPVTGKSYHMLYNPPGSDEVEQRLAQHPAHTKSEIEKHVEAYMTNYDELAQCFPNHVRVDANYDFTTVFGHIDGNLVRPMNSSGVASS